VVCFTFGEEHDLPPGKGNEVLPWEELASIRFFAELVTR